MGKPVVGWVDGWKETLAVRGDASLMGEVKKALKALKAGKARLYTLEELFD